jgi:hypothetical protein
LNIYYAIIGGNRIGGAVGVPLVYNHVPAVTVQVVVALGGGANQKDGEEWDYFFHDDKYNCTLRREKYRHRVSEKFNRTAKIEKNNK